MAYMNSGIEMKTSQYDWKMIGLIILFLAVVGVLVTVKLVFPDMTKEKLFAMLGSAPATTVSQPVPAATQPAAAVTPAQEQPAQTKTAVTAAIASADVVSAPVAEPGNVKPVQPTTKPEPAVTAVTGTHAVADDTASAASIAPPQTTPSRSNTPTQISCSAEDRAAELCQ